MQPSLLAHEGLASLNHEHPIGLIGPSPGLDCFSSRLLPPLQEALLETESGVETKHFEESVELGTGESPWLTILNGCYVTLVSTSANFFSELRLIEPVAIPLHRDNETDLERDTLDRFTGPPASAALLGKSRS